MNIEVLLKFGNQFGHTALQLQKKFAAKQNSRRHAQTFNYNSGVNKFKNMNKKIWASKLGMIKINNEMKWNWTKLRLQ